MTDKISAYNRFWQLYGPLGAAATFVIEDHPATLEKVAIADASVLEALERISIDIDLVASAIHKQVMIDFSATRKTSQ